MKDTPELHAAIQATSAFRDLSDDHLALLIEAAELETFEPDAVLMVQGEPSNFAMLLLEGEVTVSADSARGAIPISILKAPSLVGELGSLAQLPRSATARARTMVKALRFGRATLVEVARATPSLLIDVIARMGDRLRKFNGAISLYTEALAALEHHAFDPALLEELRNPIPDLADFGQTFGRMAEQLILRRQRDDEMASAAVIQRALLPRVRDFAEESGLDVWAAMTPARDVGGDFFDLVPLADGRFALGVGDVCGKGVPAALFMGITKTLIRINLRENPDLPGAIVKANAFLADNNAGQLFATALYVAYDPRSGALANITLRYAKAADRGLELSREQFEREWAPELHVRLERASTADAKIVITNLARAAVLLQLVQLRTMTHAMPFERQYLNDPLVGGNTWTQHIGERILAITGNDFEGTIAASVSFYSAGRLYKSDWFRFDVEIQRGRFEKIDPVTLPARRVRVLATRQADKFRRQNVKDVVHETATTKES